MILDTGLGDVVAVRIMTGTRWGREGANMSSSSACTSIYDHDVLE